eukprot:jgi/Chrzof1/6097/Cz17g09170.t1
MPDLCSRYHDSHAGDRYGPSRGPDGREENWRGAAAHPGPPNYPPTRDPYGPPSRGSWDGGEHKGDSWRDPQAGRPHNYPQMGEHHDRNWGSLDRRPPAGYYPQEGGMKSGGWDPHPQYPPRPYGHEDYIRSHRDEGPYAGDRRTYANGGHYPHAATAAPDGRLPLHQRPLSHSPDKWRNVSPNVGVRAPIEGSIPPSQFPQRQDPNTATAGAPPAPPTEPATVVAAATAAHTHKPDPFGGARPVDTASKLLQLESRLRRPSDDASSRHSDDRGLGISQPPSAAQGLTSQGAAPKPGLDRPITLLRRPPQPTLAESVTDSSLDAASIQLRPQTQLPATASAVGVMHHQQQHPLVADQASSMLPAVAAVAQGHPMLQHMPPPPPPRPPHPAAAAAAPTQAIDEAAQQQQQQQQQQQAAAAQKQPAEPQPAVLRGVWAARQGPVAGSSMRPGGWRDLLTTADGRRGPLAAASEVAAAEEEYHRYLVANSPPQHTPHEAVASSPIATAKKPQCDWGEIEALGLGNNLDLSVLQPAQVVAVISSHADQQHQLAELQQAAATAQQQQLAELQHAAATAQQQQLQNHTDSAIADAKHTLEQQQQQQQQPLQFGSVDAEGAGITTQPGAVSDALQSPQHHAAGPATAAAAATANGDGDTTVDSDPNATAYTGTAAARKFPPRGGRSSSGRGYDGRHEISRGGRGGRRGGHGSNYYGDSPSGGRGNRGRGGRRDSRGAVAISNDITNADDDVILARRDSDSIEGSRGAGRRGRGRSARGSGRFGSSMVVSREDLVERWVPKRPAGATASDAEAAAATTDAEGRPEASTKPSTVMQSHAIATGAGNADSAPVPAPQDNTPKAPAVAAHAPPPPPPPPPPATAPMGQGVITEVEAATASAAAAAAVAAAVAGPRVAPAPAAAPGAAVAAPPAPPQSVQQQQQLQPGSKVAHQFHVPAGAHTVAGRGSARGRGGRGRGRGGRGLDNEDVLNPDDSTELESQGSGFSSRGGRGRGFGRGGGSGRPPSFKRQYSASAGRAENSTTAAADAAAVTPVCDTAAASTGQAEATAVDATAIDATAAAMTATEQPAVGGRGSGGYAPRGGRSSSRGGRGNATAGARYAGGGGRGGRGFSSHPQTATASASGSTAQPSSDTVKGATDVSSDVANQAAVKQAAAPHGSSNDAVDATAHSHAGATPVQRAPRISNDSHSPDVAPRGGKDATTRGSHRVHVKYVEKQQHHETQQAVAGPGSERPPHHRHHHHYHHGNKSDGLDSAKSDHHGKAVASDTQLAASSPHPRSHAASHHQHHATANGTATQPAGHAKRPPAAPATAPATAAATAAAAGKRKAAKEATEGQKLYAKMSGGSTESFKGAKLVNAFALLEEADDM